MKLRKGRARYKIPLHHEILAVYVQGNERHNQMCDIMLLSVPHGELPDLGDTGMPKRFSVVNYSAIEFWPIPDKPYKVTVRYLPPIAVF